jgi:hypothetical protein
MRKCTSFLPSPIQKPGSLICSSHGPSGRWLTSHYICHQRHGEVITHSCQPTHSPAVQRHWYN